jgi:hypothetical protein
LRLRHIRAHNLLILRLALLLTAGGYWGDYVNCGDSSRD